MAFNNCTKIPLLHRLLTDIAQRRVKVKEAQISPYLQEDQRILDIGCGNGLLCKKLRKRGLDITPLDVANNSFLPDVRPIIYNGVRLPFNDKVFDTVLLITILHHSRNPEKVIDEGMRVASKLIIIEEIYSSQLEKYWVYTVDSLFNAEFIGHPHTNKSDTQWRQLFSEKKYIVSDVKYSLVFPWLSRVLYVVKSNGMK